MAADANGNDLSAVTIPLTGFVAAQLTGSPTLVSSADGAQTPLTLPEGYVKVGLFKVDGGPQDSSETEDAIEFFQDGYKMGGAATLSVQVNLAQFDDVVRQLITGKTPDEHGMIVIDAAVPDNTFPLFAVTKYKNGWERRRSGIARVSAVEPDQETRGEVSGRATTFEWVYNEEIAGYYREWLVNPAASPEVGP